MDWLNLFGLVTVLLILVPNMIYGYKNPHVKNKCTNRLMNTVEQVGRYGCMAFMAFRFGILEFGFGSENACSVWLIVTAILVVFYWILWVFYFKAPSIRVALLLAIVPSAVFIFSGLMMRSWLLALFGVVFSIGHIYVTHQNNRVV